MEFTKIWNKDECEKAMDVVSNLKIVKKDDVDFNTAVDILLSEIYKNVGDKGWVESKDVESMISNITHKKIPFKTKRTRVLSVKDKKYSYFIGTPFWILNSIVRIDGDNRFIEVNGRKFQKIKLISSRRCRETLGKFMKIPFDFYYRSGILEHPRNLSLDRISEKDLDNLNLSENDIIWVEFKRSLYLDNKMYQNRETGGNGNGNSV